MFIAPDIASTPGPAISVWGGTSVWRVVGTGDFNGDGAVDIVWQAPQGDVVVWLSAGSTYQATAIYTGVSVWQIVAVADLNRDGHPDLVWQAPDGQVVLWTMRGVTQIGCVLDLLGHQRVAREGCRRLGWRWRSGFGPR